MWTKENTDILTSVLLICPHYESADGLLRYGLLFLFFFAKYIDKDASEDYDIKEVDFDLIFFFSGGNTK